MGAAFAHKSRIELTSAERLAPLCGQVPSRGPLDAQTVVFKGQLGPTESSGGSAVGGSDGAAVEAALERLGWDRDRVFFAVAPVCADQLPDERAARITGIIEAVDPELVVTLDADAAAEVGVALGVPKPHFGRSSEVRGRSFVAVDGLEASLADETRKRRVWTQFKAARRRPIY